MNFGSSDLCLTQAVKKHTSVSGQCIRSLVNCLWRQHRNSFVMETEVLKVRVIGKRSRSWTRLLNLGVWKDFAMSVMYFAPKDFSSFSSRCPPLYPI